MAWERLPGKSRRYINTDTGETLSRRQYDKAFRGVKSYESKAKEFKLRNLAEALSRPAPGRFKSFTESETQLRVEAFRELESQKLNKKIDRILARESRKGSRDYVISTRTLQTGKYARRLPFQTYEQYKDLIDQIRKLRMKNGRRLVSSYSIGVTGVSSGGGTEGRVLDAMIFTQSMPSLLYSESEFDEAMEDFEMEKTYFNTAHYFIHLQFDREYAQSRAARASRKH